MHAIRQDRKRMLISFLLTLLLYVITFVFIQFFLPVESEDILEYSGPITVFINAPMKSLEVREESKAVKLAPEPLKVEKEAESALTGQKEVTKQHSEVIEVPEVSETEFRGEIVQKEVPETKESEVLPLLKQKKEQISFPQQKIQTVEEKKIKKFEPESPPQEEPLALNLEWLDEALKKSEGSALKTGENEVKVKQVQKKEGVADSGIPLISWDDVGKKRVLVSSGELPEIPSWVEKEGINLKIVVAFAVTPEGYTTSVGIGESSGYTDVDTCILESVRKLKFNPVSSKENVTGKITYIISTK